MPGAPSSVLEISYRRNTGQGIHSDIGYGFAMVAGGIGMVVQVFGFVCLRMYEGVVGSKGDL